MSSETEARERRRNRLLQSKEERMSRILGSNESKSACAEAELKPEPLSTTARQIQVSRQTPTTNSATANVVHSVTPISQAPKKNMGVVSLQPKLTGRSHVLVVALVGCLFVSALSFSRTPACLDILGNYCPLFASSAYIALISLFCGAESVEFLTGRLFLGSGMGSVYMLLKDFALYLLIIIALSSFQCTKW